MLIERDFTLDFDAELFKSVGDDDEWRVKGYASVEVPDMQNETLLIKGMDTSYLDHAGVLNWNHQKGPEFIIGEIVKSQKILDSTPAKLYVEGVLYKDQEHAINARNLMKALKKSPTGRRMRYSIEGKAITRDARKVTKSWLTGVALTMQPINMHPAIAAILSKGLCLHPDSADCIRCTDICYKGLDVGTDSASAITRESLEGAPHVCTGQCAGNCKNKKDKKEVLTKSRAIALISSKGYSAETSERLLNLIFNQGGMM